MSEWTDDRDPWQDAEDERRNDDLHAPTEPNGGSDHE